MKVIAIPTRLRWALAAMALCIPMAALETIIATRAQWWRLPHGLIFIWSAACATVYALIAFWIGRGYRWSTVAFASFGVLWVLVSTSYSIRMQHYGVAFFSLFLALFWFAGHSWIRHEMQRTFFDPKMNWYHGLPKGIPGLSCRLGDGSNELRVSRIDEDGVFLYTPVPEQIGKLRDLIDQGTAKRARRRTTMELSLRFQGREVGCRAFPVARLEGGAGAGFQFSGMTPDARKDLGDFVEALRGEGHV